MNLRLALVGSIGLATASVGGYILLGPGGASSAGESDPVKHNSAHGDGSTNEPLNITGDSPPLPTNQGDPKPPVRVMMVIPKGDRDKVMTKYQKHFDRKIDEFVSGSGLEIPNKGNWNRVYDSWGGKGEELIRRYKEEYGEDVTSDYVEPDNIETALRGTIFKVCSGEDIERKLKHCMVEEGDISPE